MRTNHKQPAFFDVPYISSIQDMLIKSIKNYGNKTALEDLTHYPISKTTYSELFNYILKFGCSLQKLGIKPGNHISVIGENRVQWAISFLTGMMFDFVVIPVDKNLTHSEILNIINESDAIALIFSGSLYELFKEKNDVLSNVKFFINMDLDKKENDFYSMTEMINNASDCISDIPKINSDEVSEIVYTSGSLGRAKGVMLTQKNVSSNLMAMRKMISTNPDDRFISVLPLHHVYPCNCGLLCPLYSGASVHFASSLKTIADDIIKIKPTILLGAPLLYNKMYNKIWKTISTNKMTSLLVKVFVYISNVIQRLGLKSSKKVLFKKLHDNLGGSLRLLIAGGAAPDPKVSKGFRDLGFNIIQGYGLTETSPILTLNRIDYFKDDSAGLPLPGIDVKINQPDKNGVGEIYSKGPNSMLGYYKNKAATEETFDGDWFKTGDLGYFDKKGFLHICGRKKNVIIANNGENVYPEEIEDILNRQPFVLECVVYGEKDEKHDERIAALIVPDQSAFKEFFSKNNIQIKKDLVERYIDEAVKETNKQLIQFKQIKSFHVQEKELEKTTTQKVKRKMVAKAQIC